jgi:hypothetical protein
MLRSLHLVLNNAMLHYELQEQVLILGLVLILITFLAIIHFPPLGMRLSFSLFLALLF